MVDKDSTWSSEAAVTDRPRARPEMNQNFGQERRSHSKVGRACFSSALASPAFGCHPSAHEMADAWSELDWRPDLSASASLASEEICEKALSDDRLSMRVVHPTNNDEDISSLVRRIDDGSAGGDGGSLASGSLT